MRWRGEGVLQLAAAAAPAPGQVARDACLIVSNGRQQPQAPWHLTHYRYEPFLVPSINFPDKLFCALTNQLITRNLEAVKTHMKGKRFQKAKGWSVGDLGSG